MCHKGCHFTELIILRQIKAIKNNNQSKVHITKRVNSIQNIFTSDLNACLYISVFENLTNIDNAIRLFIHSMRYYAFILTNRRGAPFL